MRCWEEGPTDMVSVGKWEKGPSLVWENLKNFQGVSEQRPEQSQAVENSSTKPR